MSQVAVDTVSSVGGLSQKVWRQGYFRMVSSRVTNPGAMCCAVAIMMRSAGSRSMSGNCVEACSNAGDKGKQAMLESCSAASNQCGKGMSLPQAIFLDDLRNFQTGNDGYGE